MKLVNFPTYCGESLARAQSAREAPSTQNGTKIPGLMVIFRLLMQTITEEMHSLSAADQLTARTQVNDFPRAFGSEQ
jgi:hypothetical protein